MTSANSLAMAAPMIPLTHFAALPAFRPTWWMKKNGLAVGYSARPCYQPEPGSRRQLLDLLAVRSPPIFNVISQWVDPVYGLLRNSVLKRPDQLRAGIGHKVADIGAVASGAGQSLERGSIFRRGRKCDS